MKICYHASHEQFAPSVLLEHTVHAEQAGFEGAMSSDHFKPWSRTQGHSGFSWSWMGAALARTRFPIGMIVAPGYRYHPAIVAQAAATLSEMFDDRFWLALGSGERLNEDVTGCVWPAKPERNDRLREAADAIRSLLQGERFSHRGYFTMNDAEIFSRARTPPPLFGAAVSETSAAFVADFSDGLLTVAQPPEQMAEIIQRYRTAGGRDKPVYVQLAVNWAPSEREAVQGAFDHWRFLALPGDVNWELRSPEDFESATQHVRPEDMHRSVLISTDPSAFVARLADYADMGIDAVFVHQVDLNQSAFIDVFGSKVIPQFKSLHQ